MSDGTRTQAGAPEAGSPNLDGVEVLDLIPIPRHGDRMVRLRTLEEALAEFDQAAERDPGDETVSYLVQVRPRRAGAAAAAAAATGSPAPAAKTQGAVAATQSATSVTSARSSAEAAPGAKPGALNDPMYLADGKLNVAYLMRNAELLYSSGEYPLARNIYRALIQGAGKTGDALFGMARCFAAEGKLEEACVHYEQSITYQPTLESYRSLANLMIRLKRDQSAAEVIDRALNLKGLSPATRLDLHKAAGNCWTRVGRPVDAERHIQKALEIDPNATELYANLGALYLTLNRVPAAQAQFESAVALDARNDKALCGLASCAVAAGDRRRAHDLFARALDIQLNNPQAVYQLVKLAYELKTYASAARILEEYVEIAPINANLLYSLAGLQFHLGRKDDARSTVKKILEIAPQHAGARELSGIIEGRRSP